MKNLRFTFLTILMPLVFFMYGGNLQAQINWYTGDFRDALLKAEQENKLVFLDFYASWCGPCKYMMETIFPQEVVYSKINEQFIALKIDIEENGPLANEFAISGVPDFVIVAPTGEETEYEEIGRISGSRDSAEEFLSELAQVTNNKETLKVLLVQLEQNPFDAILLQKIYQRYAVKKNIEEMKKYLHRLLAGDVTPALNLQQIMGLRFLMLQALQESKRFEEALEESVILLQMNPDKDFLSAIYWHQHEIYHGLVRYNEAFISLQKMLEVLDDIDKIENYPFVLSYLTRNISVLSIEAQNYLFSYYQNFAHLLEIYPDAFRPFDTLYYEIAKTLLAINQRSEALIVCDNGLAVHPKSIKLRELKAQLQ